MNIRFSLFLFLVLSGCASQRAEIAYRARNELLGMPKTELLRCMGTPLRVEQIGNPEVLLYAGNTPDYSCPLVKMVGGSAVPRRCEVRFLLDNGIVGKVDYREPGGKMIGGGDQCTFLVEKCVKP